MTATVTAETWAHWTLEEAVWTAACTRDSTLFTLMDLRRHMRVLTRHKSLLRQACEDRMDSQCRRLVLGRANVAIQRRA